MLGTELDDLDLDRLREHLARRAPGAGAELWEQTAASIGFIAPAGGRMVPTTAGLLVFGRHPQLTRPEWGVGAVAIDGMQLADPIGARCDLEGDLRELLDRGLAFAEEHTRGLVEGDRAALEGEYPLVAVREALANALTHRDYRLTARIALRIFADRLEVWSPGGPVTQIDVAQLVHAGGISFARNPVLAATARCERIIDQIGRGLPLINRAVGDTRGRPPLIEISNNSFAVTLPSRLAPLSAGVGPGN